MSVKIKILITSLALTLAHSYLLSQSLIINEVSNGPSGSKEYVEFIVTGPISCEAPIPSIDLRHWIFDDNNGTFASGSGTGIAPGVCRFSNDALWSAIPVGTIILVYNDDDTNPDIPANDYSIADGNCRLVIPISSSLFDRNENDPNSSSSSYPTSSWISGGGWSEVSMSNSNDSFQIRDINDMGSVVHAVSYGNNNNNGNEIIYFGGSGSDKVYYFDNTLNNDPSNQNNWIAGNAELNNENNGTYENGSNDQTPGFPNSFNNEAWILQLTHNCSLPPIVDAGPDDTICGGSTNITAIGSPVSGSETYSWDNGLGNGASQTVSPTTNTQYIVTMYDNGWCVYDTVNIIVEGNINFSLSSNNPTTCGGSDGNITISGLDPNETYQITYDNVTTQGPIALTTNAAGEITLTSLSAGDYTNFTVELSGCSSTDNTLISLTEPNAPTVDAGTNQTICEGESVTLTATNPDGAVISWNNAVSDGVAFTPSAGNQTYTVTATLNGCSSTDQVDVNVNIIPTVDAGTNQTICEGESVTLTATNPNSANISWNNSITDGIAFSPSTGTQTYTVTATLNGCSSTDQVSITANPSPTVDAGTNQTICEGESVTLTATNPDGALISWNNAVSDGVAFTPSAGNQTYTVTATLNGCSSTDQVDVNVNIIPTVDAGTNQTICEGESVTLTATNPNSANISWNNSITDGIAFSPSTGTQTYTVTATLNGCSSTDQVSITANPSPTVDAGTNQTICEGESVTLTATNPDGAVISWNNAVSDGVAFTPSAGNQTYTVTATLNGCSSTDQVDVNVNIIPTVDAGTNQTICEGESVTLTATNPNSANISWNNSITDGIAFSPSTGTQTYTVTATLNGCSSTDQVSITANPSPTVDAGTNQTICEGESITLTANNPDNATIVWNNNINDGIAFAPAIGNNNYTVTAVLNGCTSTDMVSVTVNPLPNFSLSKTDPSTCGGFDGSIQISDLTPGTIYNIDYNFNSTPQTANLFSDGNGDINITNLAAGNYNNFTISQQNCQNSDNTSLVLVEPNAPIVDAGTDQTICEGESVILSASNPDNANLSWDQSVVNNIAFTPSQGTHIYTVTAELNNCTSSDQVSITVNAITPVDAGLNVNICQGESITLTATGGSSSASYAWSNGINSNSINVAPLQTQTYTVSMTENACTSTDQVTVQINEIADISLGNDLSICIGEQISLSTNTSNTGLTFLWNDGSTLPYLQVSPDTTSIYSIDISDGNCTSSDEITVYVHTLPTPEIIGDEEFCQGDSTLLSVDGNYNYLWSTGETRSSIYAKEAGVYTVTVYDIYSCEGQASKETINPDMPEFSTFANTLEGCAPLKISFYTESNCDSCPGEWIFGEEQKNSGKLAEFEFTEVGEHQVIYSLTSTQGCTVKEEINIQVFPNPTANFVADPPQVSILNPEVSFINYSDIENNEKLKWYWSLGDGSSSNIEHPQYTYNKTGYYWVELIASSAHGCNDTLAIPVEVNDYFQVYFPNAFMPESSRLGNNYFYPKGVGANTQYFIMTIFDRWGIPIYETQQFPKGFSQREIIEGGWNGRYKNTGDFVPNGIYVWRIDLMDYNNKSHKFTGTVNVIR